MTVIITPSSTELLTEISKKLDNVMDQKRPVPKGNFSNGYILIAVYQVECFSLKMNNHLILTDSSGSPWSNLNLNNQV